MGRPASRVGERTEHPGPGSVPCPRVHIGAQMITSGKGPVGYHRELLDLLNRLRHERGNPSLRTIGAAATVSHGYLSEVLSGKTLPTPQTTVAIARALDATPAEQAKARAYAEGAAADR